MHIHQLRGQIQVALDVGRVNHVEDNIWGIVHQLATDIQFFRGIGRQGIGAWQVHDFDVIAFELGKALFGIDGDTAVVAHMLVSTGSKIKQRCLATVGITHQSHHNLLRAMRRMHLAMMGRFECHGTVVICQLPRLRADFYLFSLLTAQADFVTHHLVFHRILQRGAEQCFNLLPLDEPHLNDALTESSVSLDLDDIGLFASFQFREFHACFLICLQR